MKKIVSVNEHIMQKNKNAFTKELYEIEKEKAEIVKLIIRVRINRNLSQKELGKRVGVTQQQISKIENGEFSSIMSVIKVLLALGYFLDMKPKKLPPKIAAQLQVA